MPERKVYVTIDKDAPVLAFDVSKGSSHCQGFYSFGKPSGKPAKVAHSMIKARHFLPFRAIFSSPILATNL